LLYHDRQFFDYGGGLDMIALLAHAHAPQGTRAALAMLAYNQDTLTPMERSRKVFHC
jgi:hypothetical protein